MKTRDENYSRVLKNISLFGGVQGVILIVGLVRNKLIALILGAGGMGFNALLTSVQTFASQVTNLGISFGAVPRLSELYEEGSEEQLSFYIQVIRLWSLMAALLGMVFCVIVSPLMNDLTFTWGNHTLHYAALAFSVALLAVSFGETAILKATRRLRSLANIQVVTVVVSLVLSLPLYFYLRHSGVLPAIVLTTLVSLSVTIAYSYRYYPLKLQFTRRHISAGWPMISLGLAYVLAAAIGSAAELIVRSFLNVEGGLNNVGLYNATYVIVFTYGGIVFSALDSDYYPRLSGVSKDVGQTNETVNKQMEVSLLLLSPMLVFLLMFLPVLIPLMLSHEFLPMVGMAQVAVLAMYFKVQTMPVAYISLARRRSRAYLFLETSYFIVLVLSVVVSFRLWGLWGTGVAIVFAHIVEYVIVIGFAYWKYAYRLTLPIGCYAGVQLAIGLAAYAVSRYAEGWVYWTAEAALVIASTAYSVYVLHQKTRLWEALKRKFVKSV